MFCFYSLFSLGRSAPRRDSRNAHPPLCFFSRAVVWYMTPFETVNACGSGTRFWKERTSSIRGAQVRGCSDSASSHAATLWQISTGGFAWSERSREPTLTTDENLCRKRIFSQPLIWSQRQLNSHAREESEERSILLHNVWRGIGLMLSRQIQIMTQSRGGNTSSREISWRTGRRIAWVAEH